MGKRGPKKGHGGRPKVRHPRPMLQVRVSAATMRALEKAQRRGETFTATAERVLLAGLASPDV